ncbi:MAG: PKD domain-containing protein, partial [Bacteroidota bacterium]
TVFSAVQTIVVWDTTNPTATAPAAATYQCIGNVSVADVNDVTGVSDNCTANPTVTHVGDVSDNNTCPEIIARTYRVEDECGNFIEVDQTITVDDDIAPTASNPATTTVQCASDVPATDPAVVTDEADNCTTTPTVTFLSETTDNNVCNGEQLTRTYEIADDCGNTTTVTHTIIIDAYTPTFTVAGTDPTSCEAMDGSITISGLTPNTDYEFSYNGGTPSVFTTDVNGDFTITGLGAGNYSNFTISSTSCTSCGSTNSTTIELVGPNSPTVDAGSDVEICEGANLTLTAQNPDGANISWDQGISDGVSFTPDVGSNTYTVTADLGGCLSTDEIVVTVHPLPNPEAGSDVTICRGESVTLAASGANSFSWDNGIADGVSFSPNTTTTYTVTGTSAEGCTATDEVDVTVNSIPDAAVQVDKKEGCLPLTVQFENTISSGDCVYTISDGTELNDCAPTHTFYEPGCYDVHLEVTDENGCGNSTFVEDYICVENRPQADFSYKPEALTNLNSTADFYNQSTDATHYKWIFNNGTTSTNENPVHTFPAVEDEYEVTLFAFGENGCTDSIMRRVPLIEELLFYVPNTFTPDGNEHNQTFKPVFTSGFDPHDYQLLIFNRWGEVIFESNNSEVGWNGTYGASSNEMVKSGTYVWKVFFKTKYDDEQKMEVGHVNLLK